MANLVWRHLQWRDCQIVHSGHCPSARTAGVGAIMGDGVLTPVSRVLKTLLQAH